MNKESSERPVGDVQKRVHPSEKPGIQGRTKRRHLSVTLSRSLHAVVRYARLTTSVLLILGSALVIAAWLTPPPTRFSLDSEQRGIRADRLALWHEFTDWIRGRKYVVLTFDDGPAGNGTDERIIRILKKHNAHALFFLVCSKIVPETITIVSTLEGEGHMIGNHSTNHFHLDGLPYLDTLREIESCSSRIADVTGHRPRYFRPPYGRSSPYVEEAARVSGMQPLLWNASAYDYLYRDKNMVLQMGSEEVPDMAVLLMHEKKTTEEVLDAILTRLEERGFTFVLPEM